MIRRFFRWWRSTLADMLPDSWTRARRRDASLLEIDITRSQIVFRHRSGDHNDELGRIERGAGRGGESATNTSARESINALLHGLRPERTRCVVRVDESLRLEKTVRLPLAAEENLRQVMAFEMERHTPFHADKVYFDHRIVARDAKARRLDVELLVVQKPVVDEALGVLADWDFRPGADGDLDDERALAFLPRDYRPPTTAGLNRTLIVLNLVALAVAALLPLYRQEQYLQELEARAERARAAAMESVEVRDRIRELKQRREVLVRAKAGPSSVEVIDEVTRLLPDGTWLHRFDIKNGEVQFQGLSDTASALIGVVESSPMFREARFGSPITRDARTGQERFHISAKLEARPGDGGGVESGEDKQG